MAAQGNQPQPEQIYIRRDGLAFVVSVLDMPIGEDRFDDRRKALQFADFFAKATGAEIIDATEGEVQ